MTDNTLFQNHPKNNDPNKRGKINFYLIWPNKKGKKILQTSDPTKRGKNINWRTN